MRILWWLVFLVIMYTGALAQDSDVMDYIWPTDASRAFTSSFAEYRPGRFHAGVDVKTWGKTGYELYAIRDGYISRIRVSPFGYGRALYLTLDTGETVVYGHLERFNTDLENYVWEQQKARGRYDIQMYPKSDLFCFKQGDIIGYSGQSGVGYPHLHFELRDTQGRPINPLEKGYKVKDYTSPIISKIAISPMDAFASVNNDCEPVVRRTSELRNRYYVINQPVVVHGLIGFAFSAFDQMEGITNKFGTYKNQLFIDEKLVFSAAYRRFSYAENHMAALDRDFRLSQRGYGNFYQLFRDSGNDLEFYFSDDTYYGLVYFTPEYDPDYNPFAGVKAIHGNAHSFRMVAQDYWGNTSQVVGKIEVREPRKFSMNDTVTQVMLRNNLTLPDSQLFHIKHDFYDKYLRIELDPVSGIPDSLAITFRYANNISHPVTALQQSNKLVAAIPINPNDRGPITIQCVGVLNSRVYRQKHVIPFQAIAYAASKTVSTPDDSCYIIFSRNSLYRPVYVQTQKEERPADNTDYQFASSIYTIQPNDVPMYKGAEVRLKIARTDIDPAKIGIYYKVKGYNKWRYFGNRYHAAGNMISGNVGTFGTHALIVDDEPPVLMYLSPGENSHVNGATVSFRAVIKDELSGIGSESDRELRIDGRKVIAEYDPEHLTLVYKPRTPIPSGKHELEVFLRDKCGNITNEKHVFWVD